jgi:hypothetical protein
MSRLVEFTNTVQLVESDDGNFDLKARQIARVWPEDGPKRGKPEIVLVGEDFPALLECMRLWDQEGRPSMVEAKARETQKRGRAS